MAELPECDLVMKGGVTSGLVYQGAVLWLKKRYTFRNIGGTSAGAIAAALAAAAQYGSKGGVDGFGRMRRWTNRLGKEPGLLRSLFQPTPAAHPAFEALFALVAGRGSPPKRALRAFGRVLREYWGLVAWAAVLVAAYVVAVQQTGAASLGVLIASSIVLGVVVLLAVLAVTLWSAGWNLVRALEANGFGMCPGVQQPGFDRPALGEWLHGAIQDCAGLTTNDPPLTFAELETRDVHLRTITTDLAYSRPVDLPVPDDFPTTYLFDPDDLRQRIPGDVVKYLERDDVAPPVVVTFRDGSQGSLRTLPRKQLPILLATRLSLSFPILLSTIRLWSIHPSDKQALEHCFSDGGISSNFPIHFFDGWVPRRPTFGLNLQTLQSESDTKVALAGSHQDDPALPARYSRVRSVLDFAKQAADAARNWHDTTQSELPGFRDRVCHIRLSKDEGGLNLDMDPKTIRLLMLRGKQSGRLIVRKFEWDVHRFARYLTLMQMLQRSLSNSDAGYSRFYDRLVDGHLPAKSGYEVGHEGNWSRDAATVTRDLIASGKKWGKGAPPARGFDQGGVVEPEPAPVMRIVPDV